jgi:hypothetical protein
MAAKMKIKPMPRTIAEAIKTQYEMREKLLYKPNSFSVQSAIVEVDSRIARLKKILAEVESQLQLNELVETEKRRNK